MAYTCSSDVPSYVLPANVQLLLHKVYGPEVLGSAISCLWEESQEICIYKLNGTLRELRDSRYQSEGDEKE